MKRKFLMIALSILLILGLIATPALAKDNQTNGSPFQEIWEAIVDLQEQIENIVSTPGPPAGQVCPEGQFVTGFDENGNIICGSIQGEPPPPQGWCQGVLGDDGQSCSLDSNICMDLGHQCYEVDGCFCVSPAQDFCQGETNDYQCALGPDVCYSSGHDCWGEMGQNGGCLTCTENPPPTEYDCEQLGDTGCSGVIGTCLALGWDCGDYCGCDEPPLWPWCEGQTGGGLCAISPIECLNAGHPCSGAMGPDGGCVSCTEELPITGCGNLDPDVGNCIGEWDMCIALDLPCTPDGCGCGLP